MEEGPVGGSSGIVTVARRTRRESPLALLSGGSRSPTRGEPLLQWMAAQDPTSALSRSTIMPRAWSGRVRISTMLDALDQARRALREIVIPTT